MFISSPASSQLTSSSVLRVRMQTTAGGPFSWESAINTYTHVALLRERRRRGAKEIKGGMTTGWFCCLLSSCKVKPFVTHLPTTTLYRLLLWNHTHNVTTQQSETSLSLSLSTFVYIIDTNTRYTAATNNTRPFYFFPSVPFVRSRSNANANGRWTLGRVLAGSLMDRYIVHTHRDSVCA